MNKRWVFAVAALASCGPLSAAPSNERTVRHELDALYGKIVAAYKMKDSKAYAALFTPDAREVTWDGKKVDRKGLEKWARTEDMPPIEAIYSARSVIHHLDLKGREATAEATETWKCRQRDLAGEFGAKGKSHVVVWSQRGRTTFVKTPEGWRIKRGIYLGPPRLIVDGKPWHPRAGKKP